MLIYGIEGLEKEEVLDEIEKGGRFVIYQYCISFFILTFKRPTSIYFVKKGESGAIERIVFSLMTFLLGWWGFPWGPIYTIQSLYVNIRGGRDLTVYVAQCIAESEGKDLDLVDME